MKKIYSVLFIFLLSVLSFNTFGQLSGTYTIGGTSPDYNTISDAVADLNSMGVNGAVTFNIRPGTYTEQISIGTITGASLANSITITSESGVASSVIWEHPSAITSTDNYTVLLNNASYITLASMTINRTGSFNNGTVIEIAGTSSDITINDCIISGSSATGVAPNNANIFSSSSPATNNNNCFITNNTLSSGSYGIYLYGTLAVKETGNVIDQNILTNHYASSIIIGNQDAITVTGNTVSSSSVNSSYYGIYITNSNNAINISKNKVGSFINGRGLFASNCVGGVVSQMIISNNFFFAGGTNQLSGMYLNSVQNALVAHNSVNISNSNTASTAFFVTGISAGGLDIRNNIFSNPGGGYAEVFDVSSSVAVELDYNNLYTSGTNLASITTVNHTSLSSWQAATGKESNSLNFDPEFNSPTDLHTNNIDINDLGVVLALISDDIDGDLRSLTTPDIGADEFSPPALNVGAYALVSPEDFSCGDSSTTVRVVVKNYGTATQSNFPVSVSINLPFPQTLSGTYTGSLASTQVDTIDISGFNTYAGDTIIFTCYTELNGDQVPDNDTIRSTRVIIGIPAAPIANSPVSVCDNNVNLTVTTAPGDIAVWFDSPSSNLPLFVGNSFSPLITSDTTFYVESRAGTGGSGCLRITEIDPGDNGPGDFYEIQNLSPTPVDATGWIAVSSNSYTDINLVLTTVWNLDVFAPGEVKYKTDLTNDNYWGTNLFWNPGSNSWAMIIDNQGNVVDAIFWGWQAADIQTINFTINGYNITGAMIPWNGNGVPAACTGNSFTRIGNTDNDDASDWTCTNVSKGIQNTNIQYPFVNCGTGACASPRVEVEVQLLAAPSVYLGNDTIITPPFSIPLDAGAGFASYLWSTGDTSQSINATASGVYWVIVTAANGCTAVDTLLINQFVGINDYLGNATISYYPNPVSEVLSLIITSEEQFEAELMLFDIRGKQIYNRAVKVSNGYNPFEIPVQELAQGMYFIQIQNQESSRTFKFIKQ
ncbi:MAG TPA: T9SS type A sorting domain-containing protein [Bacteroidia bacterium]|nr:T9SS type A sorting domain-containing protein [Bacteroidia bacterium]HNT80635.1 T9SS type A sorting domain-containing protein [Bacteroidia bacterium]